MRAKFLKLAIILNLVSQVANSQINNGIIQGKILNAENNEFVPFVSIGIFGTNLGTVSDADGNFKIEGIKPGYAELRATCVGFEPYASDPVMVTNANKSFIEVRLKLNTQAIQEVIVKASPFRRDLESPVSLRNIDIREIEMNPGGNRDISKVIQSFPGVASTPSFRNDVIVRGGGSSENRFYLDGVEIPNLNHFATQGASGGPVGIINVDFIREVNFYSGAFPADRGNALSSVLEFQQVEGNNEKLKTRATVGASDLALTLDGPIKDNTNFIFSARRSYLQFLFSAIGLPFLPTYNDFQFKTHTNIGKKDEITVIGLGAIDNNKLNLSANKTEPQRYILNYLPENNQWNYTLGLVYRHFGEKGYDTWVISRNMLNNTQIKYFNNIVNPANKLLDYNSFESEDKLRYENNSHTDNGFKYTYGAGFEFARYYNNTFSHVSLGNPVTYISNLDFFKWGIFGQIGKEYFNKKLSLSVGLRTDANNYSSQMSNLPDQLSPRFSASYKLMQKMYINFNTGRYYQIPPYTSLGFRDNSGVLINKQNNLTYISTDHFVTGIDFLPNQDSKLSLEGFFKHYLHYPFSINDSVALASKGADFGTYGDEPLKSTGIGRAYGMELLYQNKDFYEADITVSYTFVRSEFQDIHGKFVPSAWDNKHLLNILIRKNFGKNWDAGLKWRFVGGTPYSPVDLQKSALVSAWNLRNQAYLDYSRFNTLRLKPFHQLDIRVDKNFFFKSWSLMAYVDLQNVYNFSADAVPTYIVDFTKPIIPDPDRYTLKEINGTGGGTVLPTIGVIVQF
jgi:hypothetical protein